MKSRNVVKSLITAEDILHGVGKVTQARGNQALQLRRVDIPVGLGTSAELSALDPSLYPRARVGNTEFDYIDGAWQERLSIAPYPLVAGLQLTSRYNQVIKDGVVSSYTGTLPYVTTGAEDITVAPWVVLVSGNGGVGQEVNVASLKALPTAAIAVEGLTYSVVAYYDGWTAVRFKPTGGGKFTWNPDLPKLNHNGVTVIAPEALAAWAGTQTDLATLLNWTDADAGFGVWVRQASEIEVEMAGAYSNGVDDTAAFQAAINAASAFGGTVKFTGNYYIAANLVVKPRTSLVGPLSSLGEILPGAAADYQNKQGVLKLNSAATISVLDAATVSNCVVIRSNLVLPFANAAAAAAGVLAFAGTAITVAGPDVLLRDLLILGFNKAVFSSNFERTRCHRVLGDCTNGIDIRTAYDIPHIFECHFWPFTTVHQAWTLDIVEPNFAQAGSLLTRTGIAYQYAAVGDWSKITNSFSYGYQNGFVIDNCDNVQLIGCGTDSYSELASNTAVGYLWGGGSKDGLMLACQAASQGAGVDVNINATIGGSVRIVACNFWKNDSTGVTVSNGRALISECKFRENGTGITALDTAKGVHIADNLFDTEAVPMLFSSTALRIVSIGLNSFYNCVDSYGQRLLVNNSSAKLTGINVAANNAGYEYAGAAARGTPALPTASLNNDASLKLKGYAFDGNAFRDAGMLRLQCQGDAFAGSTTSMWILSTTPVASATAIDRLVVYENGNIAPTVDDAYAMGIDGLRWASIWAANGVIQTSDERTKTDIADSALGLEFINALRPVSYKFIVGGKDVVKQVYRDSEGVECNSDAEGASPAEIITVDREGTRTHWGLISQQVKSVVDSYGVDFAGWVLTDTSDPSSPQALRYDQFIAPLIKAVQELNAIVVTMAARIDELEQKT